MAATLADGISKCIFLNENDIILTGPGNGQAPNTDAYMRHQGGGGMS